MKESETLDIASKAALFTSANTKKILDIQLTERNMAAHPSLVTIAAPETEMGDGTKRSAASRIKVLYQARGGRICRLWSRFKGFLK